MHFVNALSVQKINVWNNGSFIDSLAGQSLTYVGQLVIVADDTGLPDENLSRIVSPPERDSKETSRYILILSDGPLGL